MFTTIKEEWITDGDPNSTHAELVEFSPDPWPRLAVVIGLCNFVLLVALALFK